MLQSTFEGNNFVIDTHKGF